MPVYRIWRMKDTPRQSFRWAPHTSGLTQVKPKDYEDKGTREAPSAYALWDELRLTGEALQVGDVLELPNGQLRIFKYVGLEEAQWVLPEIKTGLEHEPLATGTPAPALG
jgi:hypothetical protein